MAETVFSPRTNFPNRCFLLGLKFLFFQFLKFRNWILYGRNRFISQAEFSESMFSAWFKIFHFSIFKISALDSLWPKPFSLPGRIFRKFDRRRV